MGRRNKQRVKGVHFDDIQGEQRTFEQVVEGDLFVLLYDIAEKRGSQPNAPDYVKEIISEVNESKYE